MDLRVELRQLREVLPNYAPQDYWNISYGRCLEDGDCSNRKTSGISGNSNVGSCIYSGDSSQPLPDVPSDQSSPILGISMPNEIRTR